MHELAITEGIIDAAVPSAIEAGASKILEVRLKIGELSGVFPESIQECFDVVCKGTIAEGAKLVVERIPVTIVCPECGYEGVIDRKAAECPACKGHAFRITGGREYYVDNLKVE